MRSLFLSVLLLAVFFQPLRAGAAGESRIRAIGEWEISDSAVTLWKNASLIREIAKRQKLTILAQPAGHTYDTKQDWIAWLNREGIPLTQISFLEVATDTFWVRDYQPWYILDKNGNRGLVHYEYDRPRPQDNRLAYFTAPLLGLPLSELGFNYNGGNYFVDGYGKGFSSFTVYTANPTMPQAEIDERMKKFLGVDTFVHSGLDSSPNQHMNTFGKLLAPDHWLIVEYPKDDPEYQEAEKWIQELKKLRSPYGTPYKIDRLPMTPPYQGYMNSFVSNQTLYYPTFGTPSDEVTRSVFQKALPDYEIVPVSGAGTLASDAVHCRTNNFFRVNTIFLFPELRRPPKQGEPIEIAVEVYPSPGNTIESSPTLSWWKNGEEQASLPLDLESGRWYRTVLPAQEKGTQLSFYVEAIDTSGERKRVPINAPKHLIELTVE